MKTLAVAALLFLVSCAPVYKSVVAPGYEGQKIQAASLCIAPINDITVSYSGDVKNELGEGNPNQLITQHFNDMLLRGLRDHSTFNAPRFGKYDTQPSMMPTKFDLGGVRKLELQLPTGPRALSFDGDTPDVVLLIQDLYLGTMMLDDNSGPFGAGGYNDPGFPSEIASTSSFSYALSGTGSRGFSPPQPMFNPGMNHTYSRPKSKYLVFECGFAFWDNRTHQVVVYGRIFAKSKADSHGLGIVQIISQQNWDDVDHLFVTALLLRSPFHK